MIRLMGIALVLCTVASCKVENSSLTLDEMAAAENPVLQPSSAKMAYIDKTDTLKTALFRLDHETQSAQVVSLGGGEALRRIAVGQPESRGDVVAFAGRSPEGDLTHDIEISKTGQVLHVYWKELSDHAIAILPESHSGEMNATKLDLLYRTDFGENQFHDVIFWSTTPDQQLSYTYLSHTSVGVFGFTKGLRTQLQGQSFACVGLPILGRAEADGSGGMTFSLKYDNSPFEVRQQQVIPRQPLVSSKLKFNRLASTALMGLSQMFSLPVAAPAGVTK